jgi:hypothetical protein
MFDQEGSQNISVIIPCNKFPPKKKVFQLLKNAQLFLKKNNNLTENSENISHYY